MTTIGKEFKITSWFRRNDDLEPEEVKPSQPSLIHAFAVAEEEFHKQYPRPYSMSITDGESIWKWKFGRRWEKQEEVSANQSLIAGALKQTFGK